MATVKQAVEKCLNGKFDIKSEQLLAIQNIFEGFDTLCILATGFGKSLIYQLLPSLFLELKDTCDVTTVQRPIVIVLSPFLSIIEDQVKSANSSGFNLTASSLDSKLFDQISTGKFNIIFGTPESWLENKKWRDMLGNDFFTSNIVCIVLDEVHKVALGKSDSGKPFREIFSQLSIVRSVTRENIPVLALSATVNVDLTELIIQSCNLSSRLKIVSSCVDRPNVRLCVVPMKGKNFLSLHWVADLLKQKREDAPRFIIYCRSVALVGWLYSKFLNFLSKECPTNIVKHLIGMYHCMTLEKKKNLILNSLSTETSKMRLVIATSSLGCGVNAIGVNYVIHFGPSYEIVDYCQQIGRAGRNTNNQCHAILYTYSQGNSKVSSKMKAYAKSTDQCLRSLLFSEFNHDGIIKPIKPSHNCCSFCAVKCSCNLTLCKAYPFELKIKQESDIGPVFRKVPDDLESLVVELLHELRSKSFSSTILMSPELASGLPDYVIDEIVSKLPFINSIECLEEHTSIVDSRVMAEVLLIVKEVFEDFEFDFDEHIGSVEFHGLDTLELSNFSDLEIDTSSESNSDSESFDTGDL